MNTTRTRSEDWHGLVESPDITPVLHCGREELVTERRQELLNQTHRVRVLVHCQLCHKHRRMQTSRCVNVCVCV